MLFKAVCSARAMTAKMASCRFGKGVSWWCPSDPRDPLLLCPECGRVVSSVCRGVGVVPFCFMPFPGMLLLLSVRCGPGLRGGAVGKVW